MLLEATGNVPLQFFFRRPCVRFRRLPTELAR